MKIIAIMLFGSLTQNESICGGAINDPQNLWMIDQQYALIDDLARGEDRVALISLPDCEEVNNIRIGQGPGELNSSDSQITVSIADESIFIWDRGSMVLSEYDTRLNHLQDHSLDSENYLRGLLFGDYILGVNMDYDKTLALSEVTQPEDMQTDLITHLDQDDLLSYINFKNPLLLQETIVIGDGKRAFVGFGYSANVISLDHTGITGHTREPEDADLPSPDPDLGTYAIPDLEETPLYIRDIAVDGDFLYVLSQPELMEDLGLLDRISPSRLESSLLEYEHSDQVHVYGIDDLSYHTTIELSEKANSIDVVDGTMYYTKSMRRSTLNMEEISLDE